MGHEAVAYIATDANWHNGCAVGNAVSVEQITKVMDAFREVERENNRMLVEGLRAYFESCKGTNLSGWAYILRIPDYELAEVMDGKREPSGYFWDQIRRHFEPMRKAVKP